MSTNGVLIGMTMITTPLPPRLIPLVLHLALAACFVGVVGATARGTVVWLTAATTLLTTGSTASACALLSSSYLKRNKKLKKINIRSASIL